jgi:(p)ppGpp synthase/HD superfamily hydrolase
VFLAATAADPDRPATVRTVLGTRFEQALGYAAKAHADQVRKGTDIPYVAHLLGVAALVLEDGGDEDQAIAALLHDVVEDRGGEPRLEDVRARFGDRVASIVDACTDSYGEPKPGWKQRKDMYLIHLRKAHDEAALRVSLADELHNARAILRDLRSRPDPAEFWQRFNAGRDCQLWYYRALVDAFRTRAHGPMVDELDEIVAEMEIVAGGPSKGCRG